MSDIAGLPAISASMMAGIAALKAANEMAQVSTQILASGSTAGTRAALPYTQLLDKLA